MDLLQAYLYLIFCNFFMELSLFLVILSFLDHPISWKKMAALSAVVDLAGSLPVFGLTMFSGGRLWVVFLAENLSLFLNVAAVFLVYEKDKRKAVIASCLGYTCYYQIYTGSFCAVSITGSILSILICAVLCYGAGKILRRSGVSDGLDFFLEERKAVSFPVRNAEQDYGREHLYKKSRQQDHRRQNGLLVISLLLSQSWYLYKLLSRWLSGFMELFAYQIWLFSALLFAVLLYIAFYARHRQKEEAQEAILLQQQIYIESLEELERDMRMYRHDYRNMLSGLMLSANEGDMAAVREFLQNTAGSFEEVLGKRIQQTTQIANIRQTSLKSLVLMKLIQMQKLGIAFHFEAMYPVEEVPMNPTDLNRCVGILLDNAIEETAKQDDGRVDLIFSRQGRYLTILVENTIEENVDLSCLFREGYSTKGEKRGIGLASYARIVDKYKNVMSMTGIRDRKLVQELKILYSRGQ